jgi:hypothetical protein
MGTLGPYLAEQWMGARGDDFLVVFAFIDNVLVLEFARSGFCEICFDDDTSQVPILRLLDLVERRTPEKIWKLALERAGDEKRAIAAILYLGHRCLFPDGLHHDTGKDFLTTFGMAAAYPD